MTIKVSRRSFAAGVVSIGMAGKAAFAQETPRRGGTLVATWGGGEPQACYVPAGGGSSPTFSSSKLLERLGNRQMDGQFVGELAEGWKPSADFKSYTVKLRKGVKFHDGKDMTVTAKVGDQKEESAIIKAKADGKSGESAKPEPMSYGVSLAPISPEARKELGLDSAVTGVLVAAVEPGSPADEIGLKRGDILQQVGRDAVDSPQAAAEKLKEAKKTGKPVLVKVYREGMTRFVAISPRAA